MEAKFTGSTSEHITEAKTESLTSPKSTAGLLKPEEETSSRISEEKHERSEELHEHEHEYGANSEALDLNKKMGELAGSPEVEKQQLSEPDDENNSGLENRHETIVSGTDSAEDIKEVDPAIEVSENIRPNDHIVLEDTQVTNTRTEHRVPFKSFVQTYYPHFFLGLNCFTTISTLFF